MRLSYVKALPIAVLLALCAACGGKPPAILPHSEVKVSAWRADLSDLGFDQPRMAAVETQARKDCRLSEHDLEIRFTLVNGQPEVVRLGFKYVCPTRLRRVDEAIAETQSLTRRTETLCSTPRDELSAAKQEEYDAVCDG